MAHAYLQNPCLQYTVRVLQQNTFLKLHNSKEHTREKMMAT